MDLMEEAESCQARQHQFLVILSKSSGGMRHTYVMINHDAHNLAPKVNQIIWARLNDLVEFSSVVMKNYLYIIGGREKSTGRVLKQVLRYDPSTRRWNEAESMNVGRVGHTSTVMNGKIYVIGGQLGNNELTASCESYEPLTDEWHKEADLLSPRKDHCCVERNGALYLSGGQSKTQNTCNDVWVMRRVWPDMAVPDQYVYMWQLFEDSHRNHTCHKLSKHNMELCRDRLYFCGGVCNGYTFDGEHFIQSSAEVEQQQSADGPAKKMKRLLATANMLESYKFPAPEIFPDPDDQPDLKKSNDENLKKARDETLTEECVQRKARHWRSGLPCMPRPRCSAGSAVIGNKMYLVGGHCTEDAEGSCIDLVDYYHVKKRQWKTAFSLGEGDFRNVDCVILTVPVTNKDFKTMCYPDCKWVMW